VVESLIERSSQLIEHKRYKDAEQFLQQALASEPNHPEALCLLAICKSEAGNKAEALSLIQQCISAQPDNDRFLYLHAAFSLQADRYQEAEKFINNAIAYDPNNAQYYGLRASIHLQQKNWQRALDDANQGLACNSDNLTCLNIRSTALLKLGKKEESYQTIKEALSQNPENDHTHANMGWGYLEKGQHEKALESFRQSLKLNPENSLAKSGLVEALKARYLFYRWFLKYVFWVSNIKARNQWIFIIGLWIGIRVLRSISESNSDLAIFLKPIIYAYMVFAISTWLIDPLSNLFLRLNVYGRYALSKNDVMASNFVGVAFLGGIISGLAFLILQDELYLVMLMYFFFMMLPLGSMLKPSAPSKRNILILYTAALAIVGLLSIFFMGESALWLIFLIGVVAFQFVANAMTIR
jgi:tetratricopeptide (TPR) repeat protein